MTNTRLILLLLLIACSCVTQMAQTRTKKVLSYEPAVVELKGRLTVKTYWGPPNYGEYPKTDSKEPQWILILNEPFDVLGDDRYPETISVHGIRYVQLVLSGRHKNLIGKTVLAKGTLFHALTGHHHTDVLMEVQSISRAGKKTAKDAEKP